MPAAHSLILTLESDLRGLYGGQLRRLRMTAREDGIYVDGEASSYYTKQLVIRDLLKLGLFPRATVRITVRKAIHPDAPDKGEREEIVIGSLALLRHARAFPEIRVESVATHRPPKRCREKDFTGIMQVGTGTAPSGTAS